MPWSFWESRNSRSGSPSFFFFVLLVPLLFSLFFLVRAWTGDTTALVASPKASGANPIVVTVGQSGRIPSVETDKADYLPGQIAMIRASGFQPGEIVRLRVHHTNFVNREGLGHEPWEVITDGDGNFATSWFVHHDDSLGAEFRLIAEGIASGSHAQTDFTDGAAPLSITLTSQETLWLDANRCNAQGPRGAWLSFEIRNTGASVLSNVTVTFAGFTGANAAYFLAPADLSRTFTSLAAGATAGVYFYINYAEACNHSKGGGSPFSGYTANYTISANAAGYDPVSRAGTVTTAELLSANAGGIAQSSTLGPGIYIGQLLTQTVVYSFGNNSDLFFQPAGDAGLPDGCLRLVGSTVTSLSGGVTGITVGQQNYLAFPNASVPGGGGTVSILYTWEINCRNPQVTLHPWSAARSGSKYKYTGFASSTILPAALPALLSSKSASPSILENSSGGPVTWSVLFTNSSPVSVTLDSISDTLPGCMTIQNPTAAGSNVTAANSASLPVAGTTGTVTWRGSGLGYPIAANSTLTLVYTTAVAGCSNGLYSNSVTGLMGSTVVGPASAAVNIGLTAALGLTKNVSPSTFYSSGQGLTYTYIIKNIGTGSSITGPFTVTDSKTVIVLGVTYPAGTPFQCGDGPLAAGETTSCTATYSTTAADVTAGTVGNSARVRGSGYTSTPAYAAANYAGKALMLTKTPSLPTFQAAGSLITYTYVIKNSGSTVLSGPFTVNDDHIGSPAGTSFTCGSGPLAAGATTGCNASYTVTSADATTGYVLNTASATGNGITANPVQASVVQAQTPGIHVSKSASPGTYASAPATITYTYTVTNSGNTTLSGIMIADNRIGSPLGTPFACGSGSLSVGAIRTCTATYTITTADVTAGSATNTATASGVSGTGGTAVTVTSDPSSATVNLAAPALTMAKSVVESSYASVGTVLHYSYLVKSTGNIPVTGPITVIDNRTTVNCPATASLAVGQSITCASAYTVTQADLDAGSVTNTAAASGTGVTSPPQSKTVPAIQTSALTLTKTAGTATFTTYGQTITYTYTIANSGNVTLSGPFSISDDRIGSPAGTAFSCGSGPLAPDAATDCTATYTTGTADVTAGSVTNHAVASGNGISSNQATTTILLTQTILTGVITDQATGNPIAGATVTITDSLGHVHTITTGSNGLYTITDSPATPLAPGTATVSASAPGFIATAAESTVITGTTVTQNLSLPHVSLSGLVTDLGAQAPIAGATVTLTQGSTTCTTTSGAGGGYSFVYPACPLLAGPATVTATITGYQSASANPTILSTGPTTQNLDLGTADLIITKTDSLSVVQPGQTLNYTLTVVNNGSISATAVAIEDTLPIYLTYVSDDSGGVYSSGTRKVTWNTGSLAPAASLTITLTVQVAGTLPDGTTSLSNYVKVSTSSAEKDKTNNEVSDIDTVTTHPDLTIAKNYTSVPPATSGSTVSYLLSGSNLGHASASGVTITDTLDSLNTYKTGTSVLKINGSTTGLVSSAYDNGTKRLTLVLPDLAPADTYEITYDVTVGTLSGGTPLLNTATIGCSQTELNATNNTAGTSVPTQTSTDVYVIKSATAVPYPAVPGGQITYTLSYGNNGNDNAASVQITDILPPNTTFVSASGGGSHSSGTVTWNLGTLAGRATGTVSLTVQINDPLPAGVDNISNTASIATTSSESYSGNNTSTAGIPVTSTPDLIVSKTDGKTQVLAGESLTYTITYQNTGDQAATGVTIVDTLLNGISYVSSDPLGIYDAGASTVTWNIGSLADFLPHTITVTATVSSNALPGSVAANRIAISDNGTNGEDPNPANNTATDSDVVIAPYVVIEKHAAVPAGNPQGAAYIGQNLTYTIDWRNAGSATAPSVLVSDTLPTYLTFVSADNGGTYDSGTRQITWDLGSKAAGAGGTLSLVVTVNAGAGGFLQTTPTLSTETGSGSVTVTSSTSAPPTGSKPWCELDQCAAFRDIYQGTNGTPPAGYNDNPRMTAFDDTGWTQPQAASTTESFYWTNPSNLAAEWVAPNTDGHPEGNFTFFRQAFCLPLNATGVSANLDLAGDDVSDIYLNGIYLGQKIGAGAAQSFDGSAGIQSGINLLAVQLLNNRHGGHAILGGQDHIGLLFNLHSAYTGLRPFAYGPDTVLENQSLTFNADENALGGRRPYVYRIDFGDGSPSIPYQPGTSFTHSYSTPGTYTATLTARAAYGCTATDQVTVNVLPAGANMLANPAAVTYTDTNGKSLSGTSGTGLELLPAADLSLTKTDHVSSVNAAGTTVYTVQVTNAGPSAANGAIFSDPAVSGLQVTSVTCGSASGGAACPSAGNTTVSLMQGAGITIPTLPVGGSVTFTINASVTATEGQVTNRATIATPPGTSDLVIGNNTSSDENTITPLADVSIAKMDTPDPVPVGGLLTYILSVSNAGPSIASMLTVTDTLPAGVTFVSAKGQDWICQESAGAVTCTRDALAMGTASNITLQVMMNAAAAGSLANTATVTSATADPDGTDNSASATTTVQQSADLSVTKSSNLDPAIAGNNLTYTITVRNAGPSNAQNIQAIEGLPPGVTFVSTSGCTESPGGGVPNCSLGTIAAGGSKQYTVTVKVNAGAAGTLINQVSANSTISDPNRANNIAGPSTAVNVNVDLSVTKTDSIVKYTPGTNVVYTVTVTNHGPSNAVGITVTDPLPAGTTGSWTAVLAGGASGNTFGTGNMNEPANIPSGGSISYTVTVAVPSSYTGNLVNTATAAPPAGVTDSVPGNNSATDTDTQLIRQDLSIAKTHSGGSLAQGQTGVPYSITVRNDGGEPTSGPVTVTDTLPTGLTATAIYGTGWSCNLSTLSCSRSDALNPGGSYPVITLMVNVDSRAPASLINRVAVSGGGDTNLTNDSAGDPTAIIAPNFTDLSNVIKTVDNLRFPILRYTVTLINSGSGSALGAIFLDNIPLDTVYIANSITRNGMPVSDAYGDADGGFDQANNRIAVPIGTINPGAQAIVSFSVRVNAAGISNISNQGRIAGDNFVEEPTDDPRTTSPNDPTILTRSIPVTTVPALQEWGLLLLGLLIGLSGILLMKKRRRLS